MNIISSLRSILTNNIEIHVSPDTVTFYIEKRVLQSKPILWLSTDEKSPRLLACGDMNVPSEPYIKIDIFNFEEIPEISSANPYQCLFTFFDYKIRELVKNDFSIFRPKITVQNLNSLAGLMPENKKEFIEKALIECGARVCEFK